MDPYDHDLERGLRNRRALLGDAWVDQSTARSNAFNADFQAFITRYAWHEVWGRPGLDATTRRLVVLAITCALGRWEEFELHLRAALVGGSGAPLGAGDLAATALSPDEVKELLMQAAIYAGVPAANTGMAIAQKLLRELGHELAPLPASEVAHTGCGRSHRTASFPALHYTVRAPRAGTTPRGTVVMSHALGCDVSMWDLPANLLAADGWRVVCYEHRGHGDSDVPPGPYAMADLAADALRLLDEVAPAEPVVWVGLSMGGMVGQEVAIRAPQRLRAMVLANTSSGYDAAGRAGWQQRIDAITAALSCEAVADLAMQRWFSDAFRAEQPATVARWRRRVASNHPAGYVACCEALQGLDTTERLRAVRVPALVIAGELDPGTPVAMSEVMVAALPDARLVVLPGASHLSVLEQPREFCAALQDFLATLG